MKHTTIATLAAAALFLEGCSGAYWGNLIVLAISAGVFYGTLTLGRSPTPTRTPADESQATAPRTTT